MWEREILLVETHWGADAINHGHGFIYDLCGYQYLLLMMTVLD